MKSINGADQDRFLGALLGMAIGDALGMPVAELSAAVIQERFGAIDSYHGRELEDGAAIKPGEFTDETEIALCIVESITTNNGSLDPDNIGARLLFLARGESRRWMKPDTLTALKRAEATLDYEAPIDEDGPATGDVAARGVSIGLLHSVGALDEAKLRTDAEVVTRLTHGSPATIQSTTGVAFATQLAARGEIQLIELAKQTANFLGGGALVDKLELVDELASSNSDPISAIEKLGSGLSAAEAVGSAVYVAITAQSFEEAVFAAVSAGGAADTRGAIAGALRGAAVGATGISQRLIDGLESRIYVSLAAPWFHKIALRRAGLVIDLRPRLDGGI